MAYLNPRPPKLQNRWCTTSKAVVPGGLVHSHHAASGSATSMEVTITVEVSPPDNSSYFWAQQFFTSTTVDHGGYFGIQTGGNIKDEGIVGKMFIFSIWNAVQAEAGPGATAQKFGGEGVGYSVRMPYQWQANTPYRFRLEQDDEFWWRLTITPPNLPAIYLGRIRITQVVPLQTWFAEFTEYFGTLSACTDLPPTKASFSNFTYGEQSVAVWDASSIPEQPPNYPCSSHAHGYILGDSAVHEVRTTIFYDDFE